MEFRRVLFRSVRSRSEFKTTVATSAMAAVYVPSIHRATQSGWVNGWAALDWNIVVHQKDGVQTCALPICAESLRVQNDGSDFCHGRSIRTFDSPSNSVWVGKWVGCFRLEHRRASKGWSSDVCSSDLCGVAPSSKRR